MGIEVIDITRSFGKQKALDHVSFSIAPGEVAGFIGPNGAGKTTLMKIIMGVVPPDSGRVKLLGEEVSGENVQLRQRIGYLPENNPLYPDMYVREYLGMVAGVYRLGRNGKARVEEVIEMTGLGREVHKKIGALSKGYRQRVGLAQALIHDPPVLILDEPTSGLDPNQIVEIRNLISEMARSKTVMLSTHIMQEVEAICHHILIIHQGKIVADRQAGEIGEMDNVASQTILLELEDQVEAGLLQSVPGISKVLYLNDRQWLVSGPAGEGFRKDLFRFAVDNGLTVLSMQKQEQSLEEVFRQLTGNN
ncbi:MAG: ATP-binding cassette domain-containing protein [Bacteroidales bacterium]